ncbi:MAG TPA: N-acetylglucosamine kinase [Chitinophagaceae bacterium]|nr:N-acetylglucosamine kinase [Chitinophagaceae bacterium]
MITDTILIAESGSTKTDWCLMENGKKKNFQTQGINPFFLQEHEIISIFKSELKINLSKTKIDEIHFYGAGINSEDKKKIIERSLKNHFQIKKVKSYSDMLAAAKATCQHQKGITTILGTGSNSCYYDGKKIAYKTRALGYILGDEGGGTHIGKKVLQYFLHAIFDKELQAAFSEKYMTDTDSILENIYRKPFPNRYIAQFASFIFEHRGHYMIENIAEDCINDFFINHLLQYPQIWKMPVHFSGSISYYLRDIIKNMCEQYEIQCGQIIQKPMKGLIEYHLHP